MHIKNLAMAALVISVMSAPASALTTITVGKVTAAPGGYFDTKTGGVPSAVRQTAQKAWDNPLTAGINETIAEMWCIEPGITAIFNQSITFNVMTLADYVASGALSALDGNLLAGYVKAGTFGQLSNADTSGLLYQKTGGAINYGDLTTANFFTSANSAAGGIPAHFFNMKNVKVLIPTSHNTQTYLAVGGVPEPATWAMLIVGFGLVGVTARRRAPRTIAA